ncbi:MAG: thioredoxin family protein [Coriobacteriia bacterium]|nr:thioredoxin family protein [Coriobacteriia bacterium]MBN2822995.1 thioredoxin family protein [Coriobacteriia bacterium]
MNGLKGDYDDRIVFKIYDVETSEEGMALANQFGLQFVPTFVFVDSSGEEVNRMVGLVSESALRETLDNLE